MVKSESDVSRRLRNKPRISAQHTPSLPRWFHCNEEARPCLFELPLLGTTEQSAISVGSEAFFENKARQREEPRLVFFSVVWPRRLLAGNIMTVASKAAGFSFFALGLVARQTMAMDETDCDVLRIAIADASAAVSFTIGQDLTCTEPITISGTTTIEGGSHTITISSLFLTPSGSTGSGLFVVEKGGTLEINDVTITVEDTESDGVRAIYNEGTLTVNNCVFSKLNTNVLDNVAFVESGAAVSCNRVLRYSRCCCGVSCVVWSGLGTLAGENARRTRFKRNRAEIHSKV